MKELQKEFIGRGEVRGFKFKQISETNWGFIYEVTHEGNKYYEVFKRKENTQYSNVSYPTSKAFGIWAWWTPSLDKAQARLATFNPNPQISNEK